MIYELRIYPAMPGRLPDVLARFRDHTVGIWNRKTLLVCLETKVSEGSGHRARHQSSTDKRVSFDCSDRVVVAINTSRNHILYPTILARVGQ